MSVKIKIREATRMAIEFASAQLVDSDNEQVFADSGSDSDDYEEQQAIFDDARTRASKRILYLLGKQP